MINRSSMSVFLGTVRMYRWKLMLYMATTMLVLGCKFYESSFKVSTIWFAYNYEGASKRLNPNESRFNAYEIKSEEVLRRVPTLAGAAKIAPEELEERITIQVPAESGRDYIATQYKVMYTADGDLTSVDTRSMLQMVTYAYLKYFYTDYTDNLSMPQYEPADSEGLEYRQVASYYNTELIQLRSYVNDRIDRNKSFISDDDITFRDVGARIDNLLQINLTNLRSFVTEKGVYGNGRAYVDPLDYKNYEDRNVYSINTEIYGLYKSYIDRYDPKMTEVVLVPSVDKNQDFYMSKTRTGVDHLAEYTADAEGIAEKKQSDIRNRQSIIDHISVSVNQADDLTKAGGMIQAIGLGLRDISRQAVQIDMEYSRYKNKDYVMVRNNEVGPLTRTSFVRAVIVGVAFTTVAAMVVIHNEEGRNVRGNEK